MNESIRHLSKRICLLVACMFATILTLSACGTQKSLVFEGHSPNWKVTYTMTGDAKHHQSGFTFEYLGKNLDTLDEVRYSIDGPREGGSGTAKFAHQAVYFGEMPETGGWPSASERGIDMEFTWNGQSEMMLLTSQ